jgi:hypothetical protein
MILKIKKNRKKKRKRRYKKDTEAPTQTSSKINGSQSSANSKKEELSSSISTENPANPTINGDIAQKKSYRFRNNIKKGTNYKNTD